MEEKPTTVRTELYTVEARIVRTDKLYNTVHTKMTGSTEQSYKKVPGYENAESDLWPPSTINSKYCSR